jgi:hypothetical protein
LGASALSKQLAVDVHYHGGSWPPVVVASQEALRADTAAFGPSSECIVPFFEETGAAAAGASDLTTAERQYRHALAQLPDRSDSMFYRAALTENLARLLYRGDQQEAAARIGAEGNRIRNMAQAGDVFEDIYRVMRSWVGPSLLEPVFLGPTTGAQVLDDMAVRIGFYDDPFGFQLNELHAQSTLSGLSDVPDRLQETLEHNRLSALLSFAVAQDNRTALAHIAELKGSLIGRMAMFEPRLDLDRERLGLIAALKAEGRLGETQEVMAAVAPESLAADNDLALATYPTRADLMLAAGNLEGARPMLEMAEAQLAPPPLPQREKKDLFVAEHAVGDLLAHDSDGAFAA